MFDFIKDKLRKSLEERLVLSSYMLTVVFLFLLSLAYNLGRKIGAFITLL